MDFHYLLRLSNWHDSQTEQMHNFITDEENARLVEETQSLKLSNSPLFLGEFKYGAFGEHYGRGRKLPSFLREIAIRLMGLRPHQRFNVAFVQSYAVGNRVETHRDPKSNKGDTIILSFGQHSGASTRVNISHVYQQVPNSVLILPCTKVFEGKEVQGPVHEVDPIKKGHRYSLILNTVVM